MHKNRIISVSITLLIFHPLSVTVLSLRSVISNILIHFLITIINRSLPISNSKIRGIIYSGKGKSTSAFAACRIIILLLNKFSKTDILLSNFAWMDDDIVLEVSRELGGSYTIKEFLEAYCKKDSSDDVKHIITYAADRLKRGSLIFG